MDFAEEPEKKGSIKPGQLADLAVLSADYFHVPDEEIKDLHSILTLLGGKPVHAEAEFKDHAPPTLPLTQLWGSGCDCFAF